MEYEKGKQIEDVIRQLQYIVGYYDKKETREIDSEHYKGKKI